MNYIFLYLATLVAFLGIDFIWLTQVAQKFYKEKIGHLMAETPNLLPALVFYLFFVVGIIIFAVNPGLKESSWKITAMYGALFGFFTYATYDLTNFSTLKDWPVIVTVVDIIWGVILCTVISLISFFFAKLVLKM